MKTIRVAKLKKIEEIWPELDVRLLRAQSVLSGSKLEIVINIDDFSYFSTLEDCEFEIISEKEECYVIRDGDGVKSRDWQVKKDWLKDFSEKEVEEKSEAEDMIKSVLKYVGDMNAEIEKDKKLAIKRNDYEKEKYFRNQKAAKEWMQLKFSGDEE